MCVTKFASIKVVILYGLVWIMWTKGRWHMGNCSMLVNIKIWTRLFCAERKILGTWVALDRVTCRLDCELVLPWFNCCYRWGLELSFCIIWLNTYRMLTFLWTFVWFSTGSFEIHIQLSLPEDFLLVFLCCCWSWFDISYGKSWLWSLWNQDQSESVCCHIARGHVQTGIINPGLVGRRIRLIVLTSRSVFWDKPLQTDLNHTFNMTLPISPYGY